MIDRRAKRSLRAAAVLAVGLTAAVLPGAAARAQVFGGWGGWDEGGTWDGLSPQQVRRAIAQRGFRVLAPLRRNGSVFVADVLDGNGQRERLIVAAADAQILQRFLIDDGRGAVPSRRGGDGDRGFAARGDDERGLVPPADIPEGGRRFARPVDRDASPQRFGDLGTQADPSDPEARPTAPLRQNAPPIRTVKPRPRVVERTPDAGLPGREPGAVESTPLAPSAPRPAAPAAVAAPPSPAPVAKTVPAPATSAPAAPVATTAPAVVASRPEPSAAPAVPAAQPAAPASTSRRMADPLAIPGGDAATRPVRSVASGITGGPAPVAATPATPAKPPVAKPADVPVAPLD